MLFPITPLLADAEDWIKLAIFLLFFLGPLVTQLFKGGGAEKQPPRSRPSTPPARPTRPPSSPARPAPPQHGTAPPPTEAAQRRAPEQVRHGDPREALEAEIDAFLRQATQQVEQRRSEAAGSAQPRPAEPLAAEPIRAEIVPAEVVTPAPRGRKGLGERTAVPARPVRAGSASPRTLGGTVSLADERLESHLHETFDHRLGTIGRAERQRATKISEGTDAAFWQGSTEDAERHQQLLQADVAAIRQTLENPSDIRRAILWSEILKRPDQRNWDF